MTAAPSCSTRPRRRGAIPGRRGAMLAALAAAAVLSTPAASWAQMDLGPRVEKTYGSGLPRDRDRLIFDDDQYPVWPLTPEQQRYASIDGDRMKGHVVELAQIALRYRDADHKWWGRLPGTSADREGMAYMTRAFEALGLTVEHAPYVLPYDWRAIDWAASYRSDDGPATALATAFPVARTKATGPRGVTAEAVWVGVGSGPTSSAATSRARPSSSTASSSPAVAATRPAAGPGSSTPTAARSPWARRWW